MGRGSRAGLRVKLHRGFTVPEICPPAGGRHRPDPTAGLAGCDGTGLMGRRKGRRRMELDSKRISELMEKRGITEEMLPEICGVHYVRDNCVISPYHAGCLAEVLGVDVAETGQYPG